MKERSVRRIGIILLVAIVLAGLLLVGVVVEPTREQFVRIVAQQCGEVDRYVTDTLHLNDPTGAQRASTCFAHAYAQCQAATLVVNTRTGLDTYWMDALIVEPAVGPLRPCRLVDVYSAGIEGGISPHSSGIQVCMGLSQTLTRLHVSGCGQQGVIDIDYGTTTPAR